MKKNIRRYLDHILKLFGIKTIRIYELDYLTRKYSETVAEVEGLFREVLFPNIIKNKTRTFLLMKLEGTGVSEAMFIVGYLNKALSVRRDVCEFGTANGATSVLLANEIKHSSKHLWLFDSFEGLSKPGEKDILQDDIFNLGVMEAYEGSMKYSKQDVQSKLRTLSFPIKRTHIVPGFIKDTIRANKLPKKVSFAYIDFDLYDPTKETLEYLHNHLSKSGFIIVDDYNWFSLGVKTAVDEFITEHKKTYDLIIPSKFAGNFCVLYKN